MMRRWASLVLMAIIGVGLAAPNDSYGQAEVDREIQQLRDKLSQLEEQQIELKKGGHGGGGGDALVFVSARQRCEYRSGG